MEMICRFQVNGTTIDNAFIDRLMPEAPGEYLKVYLYLLRHQAEQPEIGRIADALDHTEADVRRALRYWEQVGALMQAGKETGRDTGKAGESQVPGAGETGSGSGADWAAAETASGAVSPGLVAETVISGKMIRAARKAAGSGGTDASLREPGTVAVDYVEGAAVTGARADGRNVDFAAGPGAGVRDAAARPVYSQEQVNRLSKDEDFAQLLYIAQKYMNKVFTQRECEVFAYLYDGLHMSQELLEYLVEYCVQSGHTSIRYIETVGLSWHEKGLRTVEEAKAYSSGFTRDSFAVMRAFGLSDRRPGDSEKEMISRWFKTYGFTRELVLEACNRTMEATHGPSFRYADKILSEWKKAGVKSLADVSALDQKRQSRKKTPAVKARTNQFHNFEQRNTDYDSMVMDQVKSWIGGQ